MIRELFCKHEWEDISGKIRVFDSSKDLPVEFRIVFVCKKCLKKKVIKF